MTLAFSAVAIRPVRNVSRSGCTSMCAVTPGDATAARNKYARFIDASRLNKAPFITINSFPDEAYNYVSTEMLTIRAEEYAAASLPKPAGHDPEEYAAASLPKWREFYDPKTVNQAPFVFIVDGPSDAKRGFGVTFTEVPLQVNVPKAILSEADFAANGPVYKDYTSLGPALEGNNRAPVIEISDLDSPFGSDSVGVSMSEFPLNLYGAECILKKYRPA